METAGMARASTGEDWGVIITSMLSMITGLGVAWFGVLKDRRDRNNPLGEQTLRNFKELTELQEQHIEALKSHAEHQSAEIARLTVRVAEMEGELSRLRTALTLRAQPEETL